MAQRELDKELQQFGKAARYMTSPTANMGKPPLPAFVLQLQEARAEWRTIVSPGTQVSGNATTQASGLKVVTFHNAPSDSQ